MNYLFMFKLALLFYTVYVVFRFLKSYINLKKYEKNKRTFKDKEILYFKKYQNKLKYCGYIESGDIKILIIMKFILPALIFILSYISYFPNIKYGLISALLYSILLSLLLFFKQRERRRVIEFNGYKIFKFLLNQISSGILVSDSIKSMYMIVSDNKLRKCLIDVSAYYTQTTNIVKSLDIIKEQYRGIEVDTLCIAIQQGIYTGRNYETMKRMETLLFKKYIYHIKRETDARRSRSFFAMLLLCLIIILMVSIPIIIDIFSAFNQIFI